MRVTCLVIAVAALIGFATEDAFAEKIRVSQESSAGEGDFDDNVLGIVKAYSHDDDIEDFYNYGSASYNGQSNGGPDTVNKLSQIFFVKATDGLSLVVVHDRRNDGSGGAADTKFELFGGDTAVIKVKDDTEGAGDYTEDGTTFTADHDWLSCCTDGYAIGSLDGNWEVHGQFTAGPTGITDWQVTDADGTDITLVLASGRRVRLDIVPEPGTLTLMGLGLVAGAGFVRRRRSA